MISNTPESRTSLKENPVIRIDGLSHHYGQRQALDHISLAVNASEIFAFLGPNGSGKTTLFRILSTLIAAPPNCVQMLGMDLAVYVKEIRREIGVVFQSPSLDKQLTVEENLRCHGHLYGIEGAELSRRITENLERLKLMDRRNEMVGSLSGGLRRRVELAKGLLNRPKILLLDEPSTGLDPAARLDLWAYLRDIQSSGQVTILLTTHLMDEADRCTRLAILDQGKLAACDNPAALRESIGGDVISLTCNPGALDQAAALIHQKFGLKIQRVEKSLRLERQQAHQFIPELIEALPGMIASVSVGKPTLEDVFIRLTGHSFNVEAKPSDAPDSGE